MLFAAHSIPIFTAPPVAAAQSTLPPTPLLQSTATPLLRGTATRQATATQQVSGTPTARATATTILSPTPTVAGDRYQVNQRATSAQLSEIALAVRRATLAEHELILTVAFENQIDEAIRFSFITPVEERQIQLIDGNGVGHAATTVEQAWAAIQPVGGFALGGANVGTVTFARPIGPGPYRLTGIFDYPPIEFALDQPVVDDALAAVRNGIYAVDSTLFSNDEVLEPLRLHIRTVTVADETLTFDVAFVNTGYRQYALRRGPTGIDATLLDVERRQLTPRTVSDSLIENITPEEGIVSGAAYTGTIAFPRPATLTDLRFTFARYSSLILRFGPAGLLESTLAPTSNGVPPPTPTPQPDVATYNALTTLLSRQAVALLNNDPVAFLQGVTPELRPALAEAIAQLADMPLATLAFTLDPGQNFDVAGQDQVAAIAIALRYTFRGVPTDNVFVQDFLVDFVRQESGTAENTWQISTIAPQNNTPFWWIGAVSTYETAHFLILTRPNSATSMATLAQEVEAAYTTVGEQGLPLEERYVAYFTGPGEEFSTYTGATNPDILGVALSRYRIDADAIAVVSRAFYINGSNFVDDVQIEQRQSTITHELVHLALAQNARPFTPPWLTEGLAVYYARQETAADRSSQYNAERLPTLDLDELTRLSSLGVHDAASETTSYRYLYAGAVIAYLIETYGEERVLTFYQSYTQVPMVDIQDRLPLYVSPLDQGHTFQALRIEVTEDALTESFGLTLAALDAALKEWLLAK